MVDINVFKKYLGLMPDDSDTEIAQLCLNAAVSKAKNAGIPFDSENAMRDIFICGLAGYWFDNRNLAPVGQDNGDTQRMINAFILELRYSPRTGAKKSGRRSGGRG